MKEEPLVDNVDLFKNILSLKHQNVHQDVFYQSYCVHWKVLDNMQDKYYCSLIYT